MLESEQQNSQIKGILQTLKFLENFFFRTDSNNIKLTSKKILFWILILKSVKEVWRKVIVHFCSGVKVVRMCILNLQFWMDSPTELCMCIIFSSKFTEAIKSNGEAWKRIIMSKHLVLLFVREEKNNPRPCKTHFHMS